MKRMIFAFLLVFIFVLPVHAGTDTPADTQRQMPCGMMMGGMASDGMQMPQGMAMMPMCMSMMQQMSGQGMAMQEMMYMMKDIIRIQEHMMAGVKKENKKNMSKELTRMMEKLDMMMSHMQGMMMKGMMMPPPAPPKTESGKENKKGEQHKH